MCKIDNFSKIMSFTVPSFTSCTSFLFIQNKPLIHLKSVWLFRLIFRLILIFPRIKNIHNISFIAKWHQKQYFCFSRKKLSILKDISLQLVLKNFGFEKGSSRAERHFNFLKLQDDLLSYCFRL